MTAYRFVTLTCDECGEIHDDGQSRGIRAARADAKEHGWHYSRERGDTCPLHHGWRRTVYGYEPA
jgi:hypothetical protein